MWAAGLAEERMILDRKPPKLPEARSVAAAVTNIASAAPWRRAGRAKSIRRDSKYRFGGIPRCSWQHMCNVHSESIPIALQISGMYRGCSGLSSTILRNRRTTVACWLCAKLFSLSSPSARQLRNCFDQLPLVRTFVVQIGDYFGRIFRKVSGCSVQSLKSRHGVCTIIIAPSNAISATGSDLLP